MTTGGHFMGGLLKRIICEEGGILWQYTGSDNLQFAIYSHGVFLMIRLVFWSRCVGVILCVSRMSTYLTSKSINVTRVRHQIGIHHCRRPGYFWKHISYHAKVLVDPVSDKLVPRTLNEGLVLLRYIKEVQRCEQLGRFGIGDNGLWSLRRSS